jgi:hypothetical protein
VDAMAHQVLGVLGNSTSTLSLLNNEDRHMHETRAPKPHGYEGISRHVGQVGSMFDCECAICWQCFKISATVPGILEAFAFRSP